MTVRVLIVEDMMMLRCFMQRHLAHCQDIEVVAEANDGRTGVKLAIQHRPDVVLMDVGLPRLNGIDAAKKIKAAGIDSKVLFVSCHTAADVVRRAMRAGGHGYLGKDVAPGKLELAIRAVADGAVFYAFGRDGERARDKPEPGSNQPALSLREREVAQLLAEGFSDKEVADELQIGQSTVRWLHTRIYSKLRLHNLAELTQYAVRDRLIFVAHMHGDDAASL